MKTNKKNAFTLVELLAVIVILAIILVIAVPKIMNVIKDTTKASLESSAKMVAAQVENQYTVAQTLGKEFGDTGSCMEDWAGLNETDYESCTYEIVDGNAKVTLVGQGKFKNLNVCNGTRSGATATEEECILTCKDNEVLLQRGVATKPYVIKNYDSCVSYLSEVYAADGAPQEFIDDFVPSVCNGDGFEGNTTQDILNWDVEDGFYTETMLVEYGIVVGTKKNVCVPATPAECFEFDSSTGSITGYDISCGTDVVIPSTINNVSVTKIEEHAFYDTEEWHGIEITSVVIPDTVTSIGYGAFMGSLITSLTIPSSVTFIGQNAFMFNPLANVALGNPSADIGCSAFGDSNTIITHNLPTSYENCILG